MLDAASYLKGAGKKVVVFDQDTVFGHGNYAAVKAVIGGKGHTVTEISVPLTATDFTPFAQQAKNANPDLLFVAWAGTTAGAMWKSLDQQNVFNGTDVVTGLAERATWSALGDQATKIHFLSHYVYTAPKNKVNDWLVNADAQAQPGAGHLHAGRLRRWRRCSCRRCRRATTTSTR